MEPGHDLPRLRHDHGGGRYWCIANKSDLVADQDRAPRGMAGGGLDTIGLTCRDNRGLGPALRKPRLASLPRRLE